VAAFVLAKAIVWFCPMATQLLVLVFAAVGINQ
jgi:hypothetical protein